jgi:hypothetical protein
MAWLVSNESIASAKDKFATNATLGTNRRYPGPDGRNAPLAVE